MKQPVNIFWFRRDLRLDDNAALYHALNDKNPVLPIIIFDRDILDRLDNKKDRRVEFIYEAVKNIHDELRRHHSTVEILFDKPAKAFEKLLKKHDIEKVFTNHDYEPYATERDETVRKLLGDHNISLHTSKDQVIFEKREIVKDDGSPYTVFTPYSKKWLETLNPFYLSSYPTEKYFSNFYQTAPSEIPSLLTLGFEKSDVPFPSATPNEGLIKKYEEQRDYPGVAGTSRTGVHLRFGTISVRKLATIAKQESETYLKELIWREFYMMILWCFPKVGLGRPFKNQYEHIRWRNDEKEFQLWCEGKTGYPIVDAGMRELNATGFMHNRVRMIVASFLTKHLLIDWRWGEAYFAEKLLDYELASNNGGWQWAAGSGCDAVPYFRIFNPTIQAKKFDPKSVYIRKWIPELNNFDYPLPIVEHAFARKRFLDVYLEAINEFASK